MTFSVLIINIELFSKTGVGRSSLKQEENVLLQSAQIEKTGVGHITILINPNKMSRINIISI